MDLDLIQLELLLTRINNQYFPPFWKNKLWKDMGNGYIPADKTTFNQLGFIESGYIPADKATLNQRGFDPRYQLTWKQRWK